MQIYKLSSFRLAKKASSGRRSEANQGIRDNHEDVELQTISRQPFNRNLQNGSSVLPRVLYRSRDHSLHHSTNSHERNRISICDHHHQYSSTSADHFKVPTFFGRFKQFRRKKDGLSSTR